MSLAESLPANGGIGIGFPCGFPFSICSRTFATVAGMLLALWLRYNGPDTTLSFEIMLDVLLIVVIGGMGSILGSIVTGFALDGLLGAEPGATLFGWVRDVVDPQTIRDRLDPLRVTSALGGGHHLAETSPIAGGIPL